MVISLLLAMAGHVGLWGKTAVSGNKVWEELPSVQKLPGFHPALRFDPTSEYAYGRDTTATFIFVTPDYVSQGHYRLQGGHYDFHPDVAFQCNSHDLELLIADLNPAVQRKIREAFTRSVADFEADYDSATGALNLTCMVQGRPKTFELHAYTEGDNQLASAISDDERGLPGLWHGVEPFPDKLDSRTRYKIGGLDGLVQFSKEAKASDAAQFALLDLRVDKSYRMDSSVGDWEKIGSTIKLTDGPKITILTISKDGQKLLLGGKPVFTRD